MRTVLIRVQPPGFDDRSGFIQCPELVDVQALVSQPPIKRFNASVFDWLAGANEVELNPLPKRPIFQHARLKFCPVIHGDGAWSGASGSCTKSIRQRSVGPTGVGAGPRCKAIWLRLRTRIRSCTPSKR